MKSHYSFNCPDCQQVSEIFLGSPLILRCGGCNTVFTLNQNEKEWNTVRVTLPRLPEDTTFISSFHIHFEGIYNDLSVKIVGHAYWKAEHYAWHEWVFINEAGDEFSVCEQAGDYTLFDSDPIFYSKEVLGNKSLGQFIMLDSKNYMIAAIHTFERVYVQGQLPKGLYNDSVHMVLDLTEEHTGNIASLTLYNKTLACFERGKSIAADSIKPAQLKSNTPQITPLF